jgi:hypothetical protein
VGPLSEEAAAIGVGREALVMAAAASLAAVEPVQVADADSDADADADAEFSDVDTAAAAIPAAAIDATHDPLGATALALALLVARDEDGGSAALDLVQRTGVRGQAEQVRALLPALRELCPGERFPLLARAVPALKSLSTPQYRQFKTTLLQVIRIDGRTDLFEWCLFQLLRHYLDPEYLQVKPSRPRYSHLGKVRAPLRETLSVLAHRGDGDSQRAFDRAVAELELQGLTLKPLAECSVSAFSEAVHQLADCYPLLKPRILKAMAAAAGDDGSVSPVEREIVVAVAAVMDCPLPEDFDLAPAH